MTLPLQQTRDKRRFLPESDLTFPKDTGENSTWRWKDLDAEGSQTSSLGKNALLSGDKLRGNKTLSYFTRAELRCVALKSPGRQRVELRRSNCFTQSQLCPGPVFLARKQRSLSLGYRSAASARGTALLQHKPCTLRTI